jgi:bifunctional UDP-N-acetylglucosamine pyrophosphorylase/glucosamine-1-phosphate N-acetyltransferase
VIHTAQQIAPATIPLVVYGHQGDLVRQQFSDSRVTWIEQKEQAGTGHALQQALPQIAAQDTVLVLYGDVPLITSATLQQLLDQTPTEAIGLLTAQLTHPTGYGRIKRNSQGQVASIVEEKDATAAEKQINEINTGIFLIPASYLQRWLPKLENTNSQKEYYLTDIITFAVAEKIAIHALPVTQTEEVQGVNDRLQLMQLERYYQRQLAEKWLQQGVTIYDPQRLDIRGEVEIGQDVIIDVNVILEGRVIIGDGCVIGPNSLLRDTVLGKHVEIHANSVIEGARIDDHSRIGPFARIRPASILAADVHIGNFVEIKNSIINQGTKINHLSYIGDSEIGKNVNIGAGTITCNYDGVNKHKTVIGDDVRIGSDTQLVAPVVVGKGATIGAGSTITKHVPPHQLTLTHELKQRIVQDWQRPEKKEQ